MTARTCYYATKSSGWRNRFPNLPWRQSNKSCGAIPKAHSRSSGILTIRHAADVAGRIGIEPSGEIPRMPQQGIAATVVEDLTGLEELIAHEHVRECSDIFRSRESS